MSTYQPLKKVGTAATLSLGIAFGLFQGQVFAHDLNIAVEELPNHFDPATENSDVNLRVIYSLYDTLVKVDYRHGGKLLPGLATSWKVIDPETIEFHLRQGVVFHNGDTFDANDVVATFSPVRIGRDKAVPVDSVPFLGGIDHVEVVDPMTVRIHMEQPDAIALDRFSAYPSQIISATALKNAKSYQDFAGMDAGSGPYELVSFDSNKALVMKRFDKYWDATKAAADKVTFTPVKELATRIAGLLAGQFDIIANIGPDDFAQVKANPNTDAIGGPVPDIRALVYDSTNSTISDPRIREALNLAIDRKALVKSLYASLVEVPHGWQMSTFGDMYLKDRPTPEYNPEKAKELLKEAGYDGKEIEYRTQAHYYVKQLETAQILQSMWKAVGLNIKLKVEENGSLVGKDTPSRAIIDGSFTAYYPDPMGQFWRRFGPKGGYAKNHYFVVKPDMVALGNDLATSIDTAHRRKVFGEMLDQFAKDPNGAVLNVMGNFMGYRKDRFDLKPLPSQSLDLTTDGVSFKSK